MIITHNFTIMIMQSNYYSILLFIIFIQITNTIIAQSYDHNNESLITQDHHYNEQIGFSQITNLNNELFDPIIKLKSSEKLKLSFDVFENSYNGNYVYTFIHCDANWNISSLNQYDYIDGYINNFIENYSYSFNTTINYINYNVTFPNEYIQFSKSGNYIILVYDSDKNTPIITKKFAIYEDLININVHVKQATLVQDIDTKHEIDITIQNHQNLNITNFNSDLKIVVQQNNDWNNIITDLYPSFINNDIIEYNYYDEISFLAGSEFRDFNINNLGYYGNGVKNYSQLTYKTNSTVTQVQSKAISYHNIDLFTDNPNNSNVYNFRYDLNGRFIIDVNNNKNKDYESDYALVNFSLKSNRLKSKYIYIYGELTNYSLIIPNQMIYNNISKKYECSLYLKQGYYNYKYLITDSLNIKLDNTIEYNYKETRNKYIIYAYYTPVWRKYDRIVGIAKNTSNSLN